MTAAGLGALSGRPQSKGDGRVSRSAARMMAEPSLIGKSSQSDRWQSVDKSVDNL